MVLRIFNFFRNYSKEDKRLVACVKQITGFEPFRLELYRLASIHRSVAEMNEKGVRESNERLEYLGDAVLGAVVAEYLFMRYPFKDEGFLTEIRSRIVNRESLNLLAKKIGLDKIIQVERKRGHFTHKSIYGDMMEAFIGAIYLDRGYKVCRKFIIKKLIAPHFDIDEVVRNNNNYKSLLIEWAQKNNNEVIFDVNEHRTADGYKEFAAKILIDKVEISEGTAQSKKKAEQNAALKACVSLGVVIQ